MLTAVQIKMASKTVLECELRDAWREVECNLRHDLEPGTIVSNYIVRLERELDTRAKSKALRDAREESFERAGLVSRHVHRASRAR
jgi:hypothetical protein